MIAALLHCKKHITAPTSTQTIIMRSRNDQYDYDVLEQRPLQQQQQRLSSEEKNHHQRPRKTEVQFVRPREKRTNDNSTLLCFYAFKVILFFGFSVFQLKDGYVKHLEVFVGFLICLVAGLHVGWYYLWRWGKAWQKYKMDGIVLDGTYTYKDGCLQYETDGCLVKKKIDEIRHVPRNVMAALGEDTQEQIRSAQMKMPDNVVVPVIVIPNYPKSGMLESDINEAMMKTHQDVVYVYAVPILLTSFVAVLGLIIWWILNLWVYDIGDSDDKWNFWMALTFNGVLYLFFMVYVHHATQLEGMLNGSDSKDEFPVRTASLIDQFQDEEEEPTWKDDDSEDDWVMAPPHVPLPSTSPFRRKQRHYYLTNFKNKDKAGNWVVLAFYWFITTFGCVATLVKGNPDITGFALIFQSMFACYSQLFWFLERNQSKVWMDYRLHGSRIDGAYNAEGYLVYHVTTIGITVYKKIEPRATVEPGPVKVLVMPNFPRSGRFEAEIDEYITMGQKWMQVVMQFLLVCYGSLSFLIVWWILALLRFQEDSEEPFDVVNFSAFWIVFAVYQVVLVVAHFYSRFRSRRYCFDGCEASSVRIVGEEEDSDDAMLTNHDERQGGEPIMADTTGEVELQSLSKDHDEDDDMTGSSTETPEENDIYDLPIY